MQSLKQETIATKGDHYISGRERVVDIAIPQLRQSDLGLRGTRS